MTEQIYAVESHRGYRLHLEGKALEITHKLLRLPEEEVVLTTEDGVEHTYKVLDTITVTVVESAN